MQIFEYELAKWKNGGKILVHLHFQFLDLMLGHLIFGMIKNFFTEHLQNIEIILADIHVLSGRLADIVDEGAPCGIPFVFDYLNEDRIEFGEDVVHGLR